MKYHVLSYEHDIYFLTPEIGKCSATAIEIPSELVDEYNGTYNKFRDSQDKICSLIVAKRAEIEAKQGPGGK